MLRTQAHPTLRMAMGRPAALAPIMASSSRGFSSSAIRSVPDHYAALNLPKNASRTQIKAKFYEKYHPDSPTGSAEQFHKINEAYSILGNVSKRSAYDAELNPSWAGSRSGSHGHGGHGGHGGKWHPHSPEGRRAAGQHRAWRAGKGTWGKAAPGPQWTGRRRVDPNLELYLSWTTGPKLTPGGGMGMGGTGGLGTDWDRVRNGPVEIKTGADAWKSMRSRINKVRNDEEVKGESAFIRFVVVGLMVIVAWAGASMASAQEELEPEEVD
ncbi:hypothetical protein A1Q1_04719 [Trichosporon asahii var. asahii CBS 2479]|nr:hypothetical protein A1Q1_04719 [Trichosporon asahii var. asahii CBS 2479]EJT46754.1 hypothetical protein A1Q1_04719 [Trichosporon asahii var. asahii CBS 2479]